MIKAAVFDLDGTLLDTIPDIAGALNRALAAQGLPTHTVEACKTFIGGGIREAVRKAVPAGTSDAVQEKVLACYKDDYRARCTEGTSYYPGVREMLSELSAAGLLLGVLSNKTEATAQKIVHSYFPDVKFAFVFGRAEGRPLKPDPGAAAPVLETLGLPPEEIAYAGDSGTDITFALGVGMLPIGAPWGYRSRRELADRGAQLLPESPAELAAQLLARAQG